VEKNQEKLVKGVNNIKLILCIVYMKLNRYFNIFIQMSMLLYKGNFIKKVVTESTTIGLANSFIIHKNPFIKKSYHIKSNEIIHGDEKPLYKIPKKMICITPGGFMGFYLTGVVAFIKDNYDISEYIFSGASAGAWNALILSFKGDIHTFLNKTMGSKTKITKNEKINDFEQNLKTRILENFNDSDFELEKIYIGVTTVHPDGWKIPVNLNDNFIHNHINNSAYFVKTSIFHNFISLEDTLNCCIASSHIPLITGGIINIYRNYYTLDGGFSRYPYYDLITPDLIIKPDMWEVDKKEGFIIADYTTLLCKEKYDFLQLYEQGYNNTKKNRAILDKIFTLKKT